MAQLMVWKSLQARVDYLNYHLENLSEPALKDWQVLHAIQPILTVSEVAERHSYFMPCEYGYFWIEHQAQPGLVEFVPADYRDQWFTPLATTTKPKPQEDTDGNT